MLEISKNTNLLVVYSSYTFFVFQKSHLRSVTYHLNDLTKNDLNVASELRSYTRVACIGDDVLLQQQENNERSGGIYDNGKSNNMIVWCWLCLWALFLFCLWLYVLRWSTSPFFVSLGKIISITQYINMNPNAFMFWM